MPGRLGELAGLVAQGRFLRGLKLAEEIARDASLSPGDRIQAYLGGCRAASGAGLHAQAALMAGQALGLAVAAGGQRDVTEAHLYTGLALLQAGSYVDAEPHFLAALAGIDQDPGLAHLRAYGLYNCAQVYERMKRPDSAVSMYQAAANAYYEASKLAECVKAHHCAAWVLLHTPQALDAGAHLRQAGMFVPSAPDLRAHQLALEAVHLYRSGDTDSALDLAEEVCAPGRQSPPWPVAVAAWLCGLISLTEGRPDICRVMLQTALARLEAAQDTRLSNLVAELRRRLDEAEG